MSTVLALESDSGYLAQLHKAYDKALRAKRGVFYPPSPVVQFIVRSVDEVLKTEFGIQDGLASTITWGEYLALSHSREGA